MKLFFLGLKDLFLFLKEKGLSFATPALRKGSEVIINKVLVAVFTAVSE